MGRMLSVLATGGVTAGNVGASPKIVASLYAAQFDGHHVRPLRDPLAGAGGVGGSVWTRVAPLLLETGVVTKFVLAPMTLGSATIESFTEGAAMRQLLHTRLARVREWKLSLDIAVFALSPADLDIDRAVAAQTLREISDLLRGYEVRAPLVPTGLGAKQDSAAELDTLRDFLVSELGDRATPGPDADIGDDAVNENGLPTDDGLLAMAESWRLWITDKIAAETGDLAAAE